MTTAWLIFKDAHFAMACASLHIAKACLCLTYGKSVEFEQLRDGTFVAFTPKNGQFIIRHVPIFGEPVKI